MNVVKMVVFVVVLVVVEGQFLTQEYQDGFIYKLNEWRRNVRNIELLVPLVSSLELDLRFRILYIFYLLFNRSIKMNEMIVN